MNIKKKLLSVVVSVVLVLGLCPSAALADDGTIEPSSDPLTVQVKRIAGETASDTSTRISKETYATSEWVVLTRDDDFADAMSATGLAGACNAPIVLTDRNKLSSAAKAEIARLGVKKCYIIGGTGAMPGTFEADLGSMGIDATRVFGETASDTSVVCANEIAVIKKNAGQPLDKAIVAMSINFQDALSISSFAYAYGIPIFLQTGGATAADRALTPEAKTQLKGAWKDAKVYVPGGPGALSIDSVEGVIGSGRVIRMYGDTGYDTSATIANRLTSDGLISADNVYFACGAQASKGLDALSGAALAGKNKGVMLLTNTNYRMERVNTTTQDGFFTYHAATVLSATVFGGTYVMPEAQKDVIQSILEKSSGNSGSGSTSEYSYEVYDVESSTDVYSDVTKTLYIKTNNPNPNSIKLMVDGKSTGKSYAYTYDDVITLDNMCYGGGLYKVEGGYFVTFVFPDPGNHVLGIGEYDSNYYSSSIVSTWNVSVLDYYAARTAWWQDLIDTYTTPSMTKTEKMGAVCAYLLSNESGFKYSTVSNGKVVFLATTPGEYFISKRWNSYESPAALCTLARILGFAEDDIHNCYGDYPVGSSEWQETHYYCKVRENDKWSYFYVCPLSGTGEIGDVVPLDFNNTALFNHWTKNY